MSRAASLANPQPLIPVVNKRILMAAALRVSEWASVRCARASPAQNDHLLPRRMN